MRRLDEIVAGLLPGLRAMVVEEERAGDRDGPRQLAEVGVRGGDAPRLAKGDAHPRSSSRRMAKQATGMAAKISIER